ncbi:MAG: iojap-like protein [Acidimicrobiaceae bacterium]|nr:iojap-like protein [Acidimicrobiaceae bacterium]
MAPRLTRLRTGELRPLSSELALVAAQAAAAKTLEPTVVLDVGDLIGITDHFVISGGRNDRQVRAVVDEVQRALREAGGKLLRREGLDDNRWVLLDFGDLIVHVFDAEAREFYDLERLWADAPRLNLEDVLEAPAALR